MIDKNSGGMSMLHRGEYDEKRDFTRMGVECPATIQPDDGSPVLQAIASDLSATGVQVATSDALTEGSLVMIEMKPEQAIVPPLMAKAEVVRCSEDASGGYQIGLKILEMMPGL